VLLLSCPLLSGAGQYVIHFKDDLKISKDLKLSGSRTSSTLRFTTESTWKPVSGTTLHLIIDHSADLDGSRSFLSVTLNYGVLRSVRLDDHNQSSTEIAIPLPPEMLQSENEIVFSVEQFPAARNSGDLWTAIKPSSYVAVQYEEKRPTLDLRLFPAPLVDPHSYRAQELSVLLPVRPSSQTVEVTAQLIATLAANVRQPLTVRPVRSIDAASGPLLIVGTPEEQPLRSLDREVPLKFLRERFDASEGIVALLERPGSNFIPFLLATGNSPEAVAKAARSLMSGRPESSGTLARISQDVQLTPLPPREWKGFLPPKNHFTLAEIGLRELRFDSTNGFSLDVPLWATPDARFLEYGHQMSLALRLPSDAGIENAKLDVDLNGSRLGRFKASEFSTGSRMSVRMKIPGQLLGRQNVVTLTWRDLSNTGDNDSAIALLPSSEFDLPRDYRSTLPDLGLLQFGLFPFGLRADLSDVLIVLPEDSTGEATAAVYEFAGVLGRLVPASRFGFSVKRPASLSKDARNATHVIAFQVDELPKGAQSRKAVATLQESVSPWNPDGYLLHITSSSTSSMRSAIKVVFSESMLKQLEGDVAYVSADGPVSFKRASARQLYEYSYFTHLQAWLRENWVALPVILTAASCLLFVGLRLMLVQYKTRKPVSSSF
jgi:hypothetical protein